ncbi:hypothetical protein EC973_006596 [Apophysomyces ossiformis]|uniref:Mid2 domain-containing protein n=1 Tax=Apophysomyces ossiformis TaxID=679940 RepID=A0A8H7BQK5_9FUNG|nr:hypothetical protein EC973_006596 [Apophysomyces ossiformis]
MRYKSTQGLWISILLVLLASYVQAGFFDGIFGGGDKTTTTPAPDATTANPGSTSPVNPTTPDHPLSTTPVLPPTSQSPTAGQITSLLPSPIPPTSSQQTTTQDPHPSTSLSPSTTQRSNTRSSSNNNSESNTSQQTSSSDSASASATSSSETENSNQKPASSSNTGVIIGSVCAFVAVIGAGFGYAFLSKTRKKNRKNRLYNQDNLPTHDYNSPDNNAHGPFDSRPSPAMAAAAVVAADNIHQQQQHKPYNNWEDPHAGSQYAYNHPSHGMSPQMPPAAATPTTHDPYYSPPMTTTALNPAMNYPDAGVSGAYYNVHSPVSNASPTHYYEPAYGGNQYDPYAQQQQYTTVPPAATPVVAASTATAGPTYSAPHTYDDPPTQVSQHRQSPNTYDQSYHVGHDQQHPGTNGFPSHQANPTGHMYGGNEWNYR